MRAAGVSGRGLLCVAALCLVACATSSEASSERSDGVGGARAARPPVDFVESAKTWLLGDVPRDFADLAPPHLGILRAGVVVRDGVPVEGARVTLDLPWRDCDDITCSFTDARGRFVLARADGDTGLILDQGPSPHGGPAPSEELVSVLAPDGGFAKVHVPREPGAVSFTQIELGARRLELRVRDELGRPLSGRRVSVRHVESGETVYGLPRSDADGRVRASSLPPGCYELSVDAWIGRSVAQVELPRDDHAPRSVELVLGSAEVALTLRAADGRPTPAAQATLIPLEVPGLGVFAGPGDPAAYRVLDEHGAQRFRELLAGRYRLALVRPQRCHDRDPLHALEVEVRVTPGEVLDVALQFPPCDGAGATPAVAAR